MLLLLSIERALRKYELINFEKVYGLIGRVSILKTAELFRLLSAYVTEKKINKSQSICSDEDTFVVVITAIVYLTVTPCKSLFKKLQSKSRAFSQTMSAGKVASQTDFQKQDQVRI